MTALHRALVGLFSKPVAPAMPAGGVRPAEAIRQAEADIAARLKLLEAQTQMRVDHLWARHNYRHGIPRHVIGVSIGLSATGSDV